MWSPCVSPVLPGSLNGPFEERVYGLLDAARNLDLQVERYKLARPALEQAVAAWRAALADVAAVDARSIAVPASSNGASHAASGEDAD